MRYTRKPRIAEAAFLAAAIPVLAALSAPAAAGQIDAGIALGSDYVLYGLSRSQGKAVAQAQLGWANEDGWSLGTWFSTVDYTQGPGGASREIDFYLAKRWSLGRDVALRTELTRYDFNDPRPFPSYDYSELRFALSLRERFELSASVAPDYFAWSRPGGYAYEGVGRRGTVFTYGATALFPVTHRLTFNIGAGRFDMQKSFGRTYTYWNAGGELSLGRLSLALSYIGTDETAEMLFGDRARDRVVATLALRLP